MAITADVIADVGADVGADVAAETAADAAADVAGDLAADTATDIATDAVTDAVVDAAEDIAADVTEDVADSAGDEAVETLEESVEETGDPEGPEQEAQNAEMEEDQAIQEEASSDPLPESKLSKMGKAFLKFIAIGVITAPIISVILNKTGFIKWIVSKIHGDKSPPKPGEPTLTKEQALKLNMALAKWTNKTDTEKWQDLANLQSNENFSPHQQYTLVTFLQTQFAAIEKKQGKKFVWSFIEKFNLLQKLKSVETTTKVNADVERYLIIKDAKAGTPPVQIAFSVGCEQVATALASLYYNITTKKWQTTKVKTPGA